MLALSLIATSAYPCSTFCLVRGDDVLFGRNYDFEIGDGLVLTNQRGVRKTSSAGTLSWVSRYGSVTFNQWGREFPMDGMNEAGLVIALMWLEGTVYPRDERPVLRVLEWIQYQLDNYGSVSEVLEHAEETRIGGGTPLHYLIADSSGAAATIEYLEGRLVVHTGSSLPTPNLANDSYEDSVGFLRNFAGFGGSRGVPSGFSSLERFARTAILLKRVDDVRPAVDQAFDILSSVAQPGWTRWSIVYDAARREISWVTQLSHQRKTLQLDQLDFSCASTARMLDVHSQLSGDITDLMEDYSAAANRQMVLHSYAVTSFTRNQPQSWAESDAAHAESFRCNPFPRRRTVRSSE